MSRNTKYYADQNLDRAHYKKCKRIDLIIKLIVIVSLLAVYFTAFIINFPK